jgi:hypothetical protein
MKVAPFWPTGCLINIKGYNSLAYIDMIAVRGKIRGLQRDVVYHYLGCPMSPNAREGGWVVVSQSINTAVHRSPNKLWRSNSIFNLWLKPTNLWKKLPVIIPSFAEEDWNKMADKTGGPFHRKPLDRRFVKQVGNVKKLHLLILYLKN